MSIVRVSTDHGEATWQDGRFTGHPAVVRSAAYAAQHHLTVPVGHTEIIAGGYNALSATAALFAHDSGRTNLLEAPESVLEYIQSVTGDAGHELTAEAVQA
ncbi:hypothetical protein LG293_17215 (plasmid) [Citricoccus nitrophenolicus]